MGAHYPDVMATESDARHLRVGGVDLAYSTTGDGGAPPVLLIAGLGGQLISWEDGFCRELADRGLLVVRYDNRDVGLSTHLGEGTLALATALMATQPPAYTLTDLAADAAGLIAGLGWGSAHVVGASMGGMIGQVLAIEHPERVRSLTSIMSTTGDPDVGEASEEAIALLMSPPTATRAEALDAAVRASLVVGSPGYPRTEDALRERTARAYDRAFDPAGVARQLHACLTAPDRTEALGRLDLPTLVVHGSDDPLIGVSGGRATAAAIPGAELLVIDGMGHDIPQPCWPEIAERIADLVNRAEADRRRDEARPGMSVG